MYALGLPNHEIILKPYGSSKLKQRGIDVQRAARIQRSRTADEGAIAPAFDAIKPDYDTLQYNRTAFSRYIGANDEVDRLWANLFNGHSILFLSLVPYFTVFPILYAKT